MEDDALSLKNYLATGFREVDVSDTAKMGRCLTLLDSLPSSQVYKQAILDGANLKAGDIAVDLGCGLGFDSARMASLVAPQGCAIGVDASATLLRSARSNSTFAQPLDFLQADIQNLPFADEQLDFCKVDRTLQHVESPSAVLREMFRTLRPGGTVACAEPDWDTFTINHENQKVVQRIAAAWASSFRHPRIGFYLEEQLRAMGFVEIRISQALLTAPSFETSDLVFDIEQTAARLSKVSFDDEPLQWIQNARKRDRARPVSSSLTLFVAFARKR